MGCIRTLLAISVVWFHSYGFVLVGGKLAVQLFFIISGFLISYVLIEARNYNTVRSFYWNRALRIFPLYYLVIIGTLAMYAGTTFILNNPHPFVEVYREIDWPGFIALVVANITLIGQDWLMFTAVHDGVWQFTGDFWNTEVKVWKGLIAEQAWTLGVELTFYLIAPFILPRRKLLYVLLVLSLALRVALIASGLGLKDPWTYRFFPTELALFLFGALAHQIWMPFLGKKGLLTKQISILVTAVIFLYCTVYFLLPYTLVHRQILMACFVLALPFLFQFQRQFRWDRKIGELSYPIYITHMSIITPVAFVFDRLKGRFGYTGIDEAVVVMVLTIIVSLLLNRWINDRIERVRDRIRGRPSEQVDTQQPAPPTEKAV